ncbi:MAG: metallophosphoesterase family protein [Phenylobacterium sp.]
MRFIAAAVLAALVLASGAAAKPPLAAWVEMTGAGAQVRAVVEGEACPGLEVDGKARAMRLRADADEAFANRICQAVLPAGAKHASVAGQRLPLPKPRPTRLVILGDTGCRLKGALFQNCNDPLAGWPFAKVAALAAAQNPDLVIHVGDYYYRETPCPPGLTNCDGSPFGDKWPTWRAELFAPAAGLLKAAPWVFARGNHEDCARGGKGWFRLLDAAATPQACPDGHSAPFTVPIGGARLAVLDTADGRDDKVEPALVATIEADLKAIPQAKDPVWLVTHRPIWATNRMGGTLSDGITNANERAAVRAVGVGQVELGLVGHIHNFTSLDFGAGRPGQLIVGTGGDVQDPRDLPPPATGKVTIDGMSADVFSMGRFGYFVFDRKGKGDDWVGAFHDLTDAVIARCALRAGRLTCAGV